MSPLPLKTPGSCLVASIRFILAGQRGVSPPVPWLRPSKVSAVSAPLYPSEQETPDASRLEGYWPRPVKGHSLFGDSKEVTDGSGPERDAGA